MLHASPKYNRIQDPLGLIGEDEPVFLLRAKDITAPATVRAWAEFARLVGADDTIVQAALNHADAMRSWQLVNGPRIPGSNESTSPANSKD